LRRVHPRLILTSDAVKALRSVTATDPVAAEYLRELREHGTSILSQPPVERVLTGYYLLDKSQTALNRITTLALLYQLDGDRKWADRARAELRAVAAFSDWHPPHFLDVAEMTAAVAFGYDWLYDVLTPEERAAIRTALVEKGLEPALPLYRGQRGWVAASHNWNAVCNGGMILGALAIADERPAVAGEVLHEALRSLPHVLDTYAPDGAWPEGPGYWGYATHYVLLAAYSLRSALGTDFGIMEQLGLRTTGYFPHTLMGPSGEVFNYADAGTGLNPRPMQYGLARWFHDPALAYLARKVADWFKSASPFDLLWYRPEGTARDVARLPRDQYFSRIQVASLRSSWTDPDALFVGFKAGSNRANHSHLDLGSFVLDADGVRWADDLGRDDYNLPGYFGRLRWTYYRLITAGHNTLTLDGQNQDPTAAAPIIAFHPREDEASAVADLTAAYAPAGATHVLRGIALRDRRRQILIQDEIETRTPVDAVWAMHTRASIAIAPDGTHATLTQQGKTLSVRLLSPAGARFQAEEVTLAPPQRPLKDERKLLIRLPDKITKTRIALTLTLGPVQEAVPPLTALDQWR
jgi:hypothetical protein